MPPKKIVEEPPSNLRRSTRSTRSSVKLVEEPASGEDEVIDEDKSEDFTLNQDNSDDEGNKNRRKSKTSVKSTSSRAPRRTSAKKSTTPARQSTKSKSKIKTEPESVAEEEEGEVEEQVMGHGDVDVLYELSEKELKEINHAFDMNCSEGADESLSSDDLKTAIRSLGFEPRLDEIQRLVKKFANKSGKISRDGFHKIMAIKLASSFGANEHGCNDEISKVFNLLDLDKSGLITIENLRSIAKELNEEISEDDLAEMIQEADQDGDLKINKDEFLNIMKKTSLY